MNPTPEQPLYSPLKPEQRALLQEVKATLQRRGYAPTGALDLDERLPWGRAEQIGLGLAWIDDVLGGAGVDPHTGRVMLRYAALGATQEQRALLFAWAGECVAQAWGLVLVDEREDVEGMTAPL